MRTLLLSEPMAKPTVGAKAFMGHLAFKQLNKA